LICRHAAHRRGARSIVGTAHSPQASVQAEHAFARRTERQAPHSPRPGTHPAERTHRQARVNVRAGPCRCLANRPNLVRRHDRPFPAVCRLAVVTSASLANSESPCRFTAAARRTRIELAEFEATLDCA
jgi:hypothetical protein